MKKILSFILVVFFAISISAAAYEFPNALWKVNDAFTAALGSGDLNGIITFGLQTLEVLSGEPENAETLQIRGHRTEQIALAYEKLGDYPTAAKYFGEYKYYAEKLGFDDAVKIAATKELLYTPEISLYTQAQGSVFYSGAPLEQKTGVYYGATTDQTSHRNFDNESDILFFMEFGEEHFGLFEKTLKTAELSGKRIEFAWNVKQEGAGIEQIFSSDNYIIQVLELIEKYNSVPVYIRFGAEMNVWQTKANSGRYKEAFRHITNLVRRHTTNTAMVWSVSYASSWDVEMLDYYPGDEYVDYIGVSLYMNRYFQGRRDLTENEKNAEILFFAGDSADPVKMLNEVVTKFPDKPIIIGESGVSHYVRTEHEDTSYWALNHFDMLYNYVPMVYPQVKLIDHFDKEMPAEHSDYALYTNSSMATRYNQLTSKPQFIHTNAAQAMAFKKCGDTIYASDELELYAYEHIYGWDTSRLVYYIDGVQVASSDKIPYNVKINLKNLSDGAHTLTVQDENTGFLRNYTLITENPIKIVLNSKRVETDTAPVLINDRTMVPVRVISEALECEVAWDDLAQTVTIKKGEKIIKLQIGSNIMSSGGEEVIIDSPAILYNSRTMVPIRAIGTALGLSVGWDENTNSVILNG